jgi:NAD(P)-dependent dehydrogenase (short-subunit alcohol dehydrogenase family)
VTARELRGQVVVITGAARGVGAELARQASAKGARVALLGLEAELLRALAADLPDAAAWPCDVTDESALEAVAASVAAHFGQVDVVVVNAGIGAGGPLLLADPRAYDRVIEVNLLGSVRTVRAFLPHVVAARGYVLQVASLAAMVPAPMMSAYCASKSGVEAFAHALRGEVTHHGVDVGVAYLAWTDTDMVRGADAVPGLGEFRAQLPWVFGRTVPARPGGGRILAAVERHGRRTSTPRRGCARCPSCAACCPGSPRRRPPARGRRRAAHAGGRTRRFEGGRRGRSSRRGRRSA